MWRKDRQSSRTFGHVGGPAVVVLPAALSVLVAATIVHYAASTRWMTLGAAVLITALQLLSWRARLGRVPFAAIVLVALNSVAILGDLFYRRVTDVAAVSATLSIDAPAYRSAAIIFSAASLALWLGGLAGSVGTKHGAPVQLADHSQLTKFVGRWKVIPTLIASSIPLVLGVAGLSVHGMFNRPNYLQTYGPTVLVKLASILLPMGLAGAALLLFNGERRQSKMWALFLLLLYATYLFSKGSRAITLLPIVLYGTYLLLPPREGRRRRVGPLSGLLVAGVTFFLLHLPLALRGGNAGLSPYVARISANPSILWPNNPLGSIGNVLFSVPLAGHVATNARRLPLSYFFTAVNPLPGSLTNWSAIQGGLRVNRDTPFNTFGELALYGMPVLIGYFVVVGFTAIRLQIRADKLGGVRSLVGQIAVGASLALFSISILQYNLRSSTRLLWYAVMIVALLQFIPRLAPSLAPSGPTSRSRVRRN